jgi:hypothetical protein
MKSTISPQLAISAACSVLAMTAFVLFGTPQPKLLGSLHAPASIEAASPRLPALGQLLPSLR